MHTVNTLQSLREAVEDLRRKGPIAFVATMGALHDGHMTLVREAREFAPNVVVSIFVNPKQFSPGEDFDAYPRQLDADRERLDREGAALLWVPDEGIMYPAGFSTGITVGGLSEGLCGAVRPGHFDGVATIVCKLFNQVRPDFALFGEKDWQQLAIIRRMARDLDLFRPRADNIIGIPTVREADGLAMSSRNAYLTPADRAAAATLPRAMREAIARIGAGEDVGPTLVALEESLLGAGFASVDYATLADAASLETLAEPGPGPMRLLVAARIGKTRLIDNMPVEPRR